MTGYILTEQAEQDLHDIWDYVAEESAASADAVISEIANALQLLAEWPGIGHRRADVRDRRYRFWHVNRFIIAYLLDTHPLQIIRIIGAQREFRKLFQNK